MGDALLQHLRAIEANTARALAGARETVTIGPFLLAFDPNDANLFLNYAIPMSERAAHPATPKVIGRIRDEFRERGRTLRFEYFPSLWPELEGVLKACGLVLQMAAPLMLCSPAEVRRVYSPGVMTRDLTPEDDDEAYRMHAEIGLRSFGQAQQPVTPRQIAEAREHVRAGRYRFTVAYFDGKPAGLGALCVGNDELAGIGTLPEFRRRGVAAAVSSHLVLQHFQLGGRFAWLSAGGEVPEKLYQKVGFRTAGSQMNYVDPD